MQKKSYSKIKLSFLTACFLFLVVSGSFLRLKNLHTSPYWMDEGYTINAVLSYQKYGKGVLDSGSKYTCPIYCGTTAKIANTFGNNPISYRILSALAGILFSPIIFFITKNLFRSYSIALLTLFFTSFSYIHIAWAHQARWYTLFTLFFWLTLWAFYKLMEAFLKQQKSELKIAWENCRKLKFKDNPLLIYGTTTLIFFVLARYSHSLSLMLLPIFGLWGFITLRKWLKINNINLSKTKRGKKIKKYLVIATLIILAHPFFINQVINIKISNNIPSYGLYFLTNYSFFLFFSSIAFYLVFGKFKRKFNLPKMANYKNLFIYFLVVLVVYLGPSLFLTNRIEYRYLFHLTPMLFMLSSIGIILLIKKFKHLYQRILLIIFIIFLYFLLGDKSFVPQDQYFLESDNINSKIAKSLGRKWVSYTPQPNWNSAYDFISHNKKSTDIIISSQPQFNKIFLQEPGYWLKHLQIVRGKLPKDFIKNDREYYVNAKVIDGLEELKEIMQNTHGYIVFDASAQNNRIPKNILVYIKNNSKRVFYKYTNSFSKIWVYEF